MTIHRHRNVNNRFKRDLKRFQKKPAYKTIYEDIIEPFLTIIGRCLGNSDYIRKAIKRSSLKNNVGSNTAISKDKGWVIFKCRLATNLEGKSSGPRLCYIALTDSPDTIPVALYQHSDKNRDMTTQELVKAARDTLRAFQEAQQKGLLGKVTE